jgi:radical SAM superfamily enzyme with C-terminal helix-hairpin-helix motif
MQLCQKKAARYFAIVVSSMQTEQSNRRSTQVKRFITVLFHYMIQYVCVRESDLFCYQSGRASKHVPNQDAEIFEIRNTKAGKTKGESREK